MGMGIEDRLVLLTAKMVQYVIKHDFRGATQKADLLGFCRLNKQYCRAQEQLQPNPWNKPADNYDMARNKITTYITQKVNNVPTDESILLKAVLLVAEPYVYSLDNKVQLRKAL